MKHTKYNAPTSGNHKQLSLSILKTIICLTICVFFIAISAQAQVPDPGGDVDDVPVDGGISLLVAAGIGYGAKKMARRNRK